MEEKLANGGKVGKIWKEWNEIKQSTGGTGNIKQLRRRKTGIVITIRKGGNVSKWWKCGKDLEEEE